ncbi:MAG TPA: membrane protein insertion efficiency factor YidD [bacterium]|nr:membrane protein insertion efficiency factor YidD [bacterium]
MARLLLYLIHFYQAHLSQRFRGACLYTPSCSQYSAEAITRYGAWNGIRLTLRRLWRCRTPHEGGYDPVE